MSNIKLIKHDGQVLILPASTITAIACVAGEGVKNAEDALSMIYSGFRGGTTFFLVEPVEAVLAKVKKALPDLTPEDPWLVIPAYQPGEVFAIKRSILLSYEGVPEGGAGKDDPVEGNDDEVNPGAPWLKVYIRRPGNGPDGNEAFCCADASEEAVTVLDEVLFPKAGKVNRTKAPARAKPKTRK